MKSFLIAKATLLFLTSASVLAAQINLSNITTTNSVKTNDAILVNANLGGGVWATRTATKQAVFGDPFKVTSLLADNATNVAARINTAQTWTGGNLLEAANNGTNVIEATPYGGLLIGGPSISLINPIGENTSFYSIHNLETGDPANHVYIESISDSSFTADAVVQLSASASHETNAAASVRIAATDADASPEWIISAGTPTAGVNSLQYTSRSGAVKVAFTPEVADGGSAVAYTLGTVNALNTSGAKVFRLVNGSTEAMSVNHLGAIITQGGTASTPASAGAAGTAGEIRWDASFIYVCVAANTWKRVAIATW